MNLNRMRDGRWRFIVHATELLWRHYARHGDTDERVIAGILVTATDIELATGERRAFVKHYAVGAEFPLRVRVYVQLDHDSGENAQLWPVPDTP